MSSKLNYLIGVSLKRKVKTKWFLVVNIILAIVIMGIINADSIISFFGGDFNKKQDIYIIDNTDMSFDIFKEQMHSIEQIMNEDEESKYVFKKYDKDEEEIKKTIEENNKAIAIIFNKDETKVMSAKIISENFIDTIDYQKLVTAITNTKVSLAIHESNIPVEEINKIYENVEIERIILDESQKSEDENMQMIMTTVFPVVILPFFMLTIFLVQMIGAEVNDEKTTRGMEIIISNVSPKTHFFAKVFAGNFFVLIQAALLVLFVGLGFLIRNFIGGSSIVNGLGSQVGDIINNLLNSSIGEKLIYIIPLAIVLMLLTFVAYSLLAGVLASMTTNIEDFQQVQTPIMIVSMLGYYLAMMAGVFDGALFIKILSFVPFISAILSPSLLILGQIGIVDVVISIVIMLITNFLLIKYGLKIYKVGILNYSSKGLWKKMFKALKTK